MTIRIDWTNGLNSPLARSFYSSEMPSVARIAISPGDAMRPMGGMQTFELDDPLQGWVNSECIIWCTWQAPNYWFGTKIILPQQWVHAGYSPYYQIAGSATTPASVDEIQWRTPVSDPSMPYNYSAQMDGQPPGIAIVCLPIAGGTGFSLQVNVNQH